MKKILSAVLIALTLFMLAGCSNDGLYFKNKSTVLFTGDSITDAGRDREDITSLGGGHAKMVSEAIKTEFPDKEITFINKGIGGNTCEDLYKRVDQDCIALKPDYIIVMIGVNEIWSYGNDGEHTRKYYTMWLEKVKKELPRTKIIMIQPFLLETDAARTAWRKNLLPKIEIVNALAKKYADIYIKLDEVLFSKLSDAIKPKMLADDGIHLTSTGYEILSDEILKAVGAKSRLFEIV